MPPGTEQTGTVRLRRNAKRVEEKTSHGGHGGHGRMSYPGVCVFSVARYTSRGCLTCPLFWLQFEPRFDALVVDEAQDHDTSWPGSESDRTGSRWWEIYWKLLREQTDARMAIFYDADQRPLFRQKERFEATRVFERLSQPVRVNLLFTLRYSLPIFRFL